MENRTLLPVVSGYQVARDDMSASDLLRRDLAVGGVFGHERDRPAQADPPHRVSGGARGLALAL